MENINLTKVEEILTNSGEREYDSDYSFQNFVKKFQESSINLSSSYNRERELILREINNKKKIILKEINQLDFNDPLKILDESYIKDNYNTNLLVNEVKNLENIFSEKTYEQIIEKRENLEMIKKILEYYLNYVVEMNFDLIMRALKKLNLIEVNLQLSLKKLIETKSKMSKMKSNVLLSSAKFLLSKQKLKNLLSIHLMLKAKLSVWTNLFLISKKLKSKNKFCLLWNNLSKIRDEVQIWSSNKKGNGLTRIDHTNVFKKRNLLINDILLQKSKNKLNKLQSYVENQMNKFFLEKSENFLECYEFFMLNPYNTNEKFYDHLLIIYKKTIFNIIKATLVSFTDDSKSYLAHDIHKIKDIVKLKFDEGKLVSGFNQLLKNLSKVCQCFEELISSKPKNEKHKEILNFISGKSNSFYEKMEKSYSKVLKYFNHYIQELNSKFIMYIAIYNCLFSEIIKLSFKVDYSKFLDLQTKNLMLDNIQNKSLHNIKKVGILMGGDNWKRIALQDDHQFFSHSKIQERSPFYVRNLLTIFNEVSLINKTNIHEIFSKYMNIFLVASEKNNPCDTNEEKIAILSKPLNNKTTILSSSTITLIKSLSDIVVDLVFFDAITYEIFIQIFNLIDYYFLASICMFGDKKNLNQLFEEINLDEVKKKGKYEQSVETILQHKRYANLRRFLIRAKKNLQTLFEVEIDFLTSSHVSNENYEAKEFCLPKLNSQIVSDNNMYSCMIENIILFESMFSLFKILKRIKHFSKKIELEFQRKMIVDIIDDYGVILKEIKIFLFRPICANIFKIDSVLNKIINYKWDPKDNELDNQFSEASQFVDNIFQEICDKYDKLSILSGGSLTEKSQKRFLEVILICINEKLMDTFSKIKKSNSSGRSLMLKDIKFLKSKIETKFNKDIHNFFGDLELYINSWYCTEDEFLKYIEDTHLNYKFLNGILNTGQNFVKLTKQQKKDFTNRLDETYLTIIDTIKQNMHE